MQNSYSFIVDLYKPGFTAKFKTGDGTNWEVQEHWTFLDNPNSDLLDSLAHILIVRQRNNRNRFYSKQFEAYPLEQTEYETIEKSINDSSYWFSITFREYDENFRPRGKGSFQKVLCKVTLNFISHTSDEKEVGVSTNRRSSFKKRYNYSSLPHISTSDVKTITMQTCISFLVTAMETGNTEMKSQTIDFFVKNYTELKGTELWKEFSENHRELKDKVLDMIIERMGNQSEMASTALQKSISQWDIAE